MFAIILFLLPTDALPTFAVRGETVLTADDVPWAAALRERGAIVPLTDGRLRVYFTGYDGSKTGLRQMGVAESSDAGRTWDVAGEPVSPPGVWVEDPFIVRVAADRFEAVAEGRGPDARRLTSPDGLLWSDRGSLDIRGTDGRPISAGPRGTPTIVIDDGRPHLLYERYDAGIWLAVSDDFETWTNISDDPVFEPSDTGFDSAMIAVNQVVRRGDVYVAYYHGTATHEKPRQWAVGRAVSKDLRTWRRLEDNPITTVAANESSGTVVETDAGPILFTTHDRVRRHPAINRADDPLRDERTPQNESP